MNTPTTHTMLRTLKHVCTAVFLTLLALSWGIESATAGPFTAIRIGDVDGFGYGTASGYQGPNGGSANVDGAGVLGVGDFLPDVNNDGKVNWNFGDSFDHQSAIEAAGSAVTGSGFTDQGSTGSQFTDIMQWNNPNNNYTTFTFDFTVNAADIDPTTSVYFNLVYGDYDQGNTQVNYTFADASTSTQNLTTNSSGKGNADGRIENTESTFAFGDIFTAVDGGYDAYLEVEFLTTDRFIGIDFAELGATNVTTPAGAPEPHVWAMLGIGMLGLFGYRNWRASCATKDTPASS